MKTKGGIKKEEEWGQMVCWKAVEKKAYEFQFEQAKVWENGCYVDTYS